MVRDPTLRIEEMNLEANLCMQELEKLKHRKNGQETDNPVPYAEVMRDFEKVTRDLSVLKLEVASVLEEKNRAENEAKGSNLRIHIYSKSVDALRQEIEEINNEQVLVELAHIEASKELAYIEAQRQEECQKFSSEIENTKKKMEEILEEIDRSKELKTKLALANTNIDMLKNEIKMVKEMKFQVGSYRKGNEIHSPLVLKSVMEELKLVKSELASVREEGFQLMTSMDVIRNELILVSEKTAWLKKKDEKADQNAHILNSKILKAKTKLDAVSSSEEKARTIVDNLLLTCKHLKTESEASKKEIELIHKKMAKIKPQIERRETDIELSEMKLEAALQELEAVKSSELVALEELKILTQKTMIDRAFISKHSSTITISQFEYEYLTSRAAEAAKIADKKVSAAHAWIEAFMANDKEIHMKMEIAQRKIKEKQVEAVERFRREKSILGKMSGEGEWKGNWDENPEVANSEFGEEWRRKPMKKSGNLVPIRRLKLQIPSSPRFRNTRRSSSVNHKRRE